MRRVNIIVEGQTEESFVRDVLAPWLANRNIVVSAKSVRTSKTQRGGLTSYSRARRDCELWLKQEREAFVSTMFDLYALPSDFPSFLEAKDLPDPKKRVETLERAFEEDIGSRRFIPNIQLHEFEALLFSDISVIDELMSVHSGQGKISELETILVAAGSPEAIDDGRETAPSKRLLKLYRGYRKKLHGNRIARRIGIERLRERCPHFDQWVGKLEALSD